MDSVVMDGVVMDSAVMCRAYLRCIQYWLHMRKLTMNLLRNNDQMAVQGALLGLRESKELYAEVLLHADNADLRNLASAMRELRAAQCARVSAFIRLLGDLPAALDRDGVQCRLLVIKTKWQLSAQPLKQQIESLVESENNIRSLLQTSVWPEEDRVAELLKSRILTSCEAAITKLTAIGQQCPVEE